MRREKRCIGFDADNLVDWQRDGLEHRGQVGVVVDVIGGEVLDHLNQPAATIADARVDHVRIRADRNLRYRHLYGKAPRGRTG
jgi:hypothetical protein